jgi:putative ABC transport system permease protein
VTGKHESTQPPMRHGTGDAGSLPVFTRLRILTTSRWRLVTGAASATAIAFCIVALACTLVAVAGPRASTQLDTKAFRQLAATTPAADKTVMGTLDADTLGTALNKLVGAAQIDVVQADLRQHLENTLPLAPAAADWDGLTTPFTGFAYHPGKSGTQGGQLELVYRDNFSKNVHVVAGSLPAGLPASGPDTVRTVQIAVTAATAKRFNLRVGSEVLLGDTGIDLKVTGIVAPVDQRAAPFWTIDPVAAAPVLVQPQFGEPYWQGGAFVSAAQVGVLQNRFVASNIQVIWTFPLALDNLTAAQANRLAVDLPAALSTAGQLTFQGGDTASVGMSSGALNMIGEFAAQEVAVGNLLNLMSVSLAVVGAAVVLLVAWLMAEKRREEFAVLRARGASRRQLAWAAFVGSAVAALPGAAAGFVLAVAALPGAQPALSSWLAALTVLVALAGPVVITVRMHRGYAAASRPDQPTGRISTLRRLVVEAGLALGSVGGLIALRHQGAVAPQGGDLYASAAPILAAIPVAIVMLRLYPLLVRPLLRLAARRTGVTAFLGLARAARVSATAVLPAFAMVLALSLVSFAGMVRGAVIRGEVAQSWQAVGADAAVSLPNSISAAQQHAIARLPGVQRSVPVAISTAQSGPGAALSVVFADPAQYAALLAATPFGHVPARFANWHGGAGSHAQGPIPALVSPGLTTRLVDKTVTLDTQFGQRLRVQGVGAGPAMSQVQGITGLNVGGYVVVPASAASRFAPPPSTMLVVGSSLDGGALAAVVAKWHVAGASVVRRAQLLSALERAPLQRGAYAELALGGAAAAIGCLLVLLLTLMLSGQSREMTLARATTMGLSAAQGRALALIEALPQILSVIVGGLVSALALVPLVGPTLGLSVFTGSAASVPVRIEPAWLAGTAIGLLVLAIATVTGQMVLASRQAPRSLRIGG